MAKKKDSSEVINNLEDTDSKSSYGLKDLPGVGF